jgi:hypothetical protein
MAIEDVALQILRTHNKEVKALKINPMTGCYERAEQMKQELEAVGMKSRLIKIIPTDGFPLYPECGHSWRLHFCVVSEEMQVYDPNYTEAVPISIGDYPLLYYGGKKNLEILAEEVDGNWQKVEF